MRNAPFLAAALVGTAALAACAPPPSTTVVVTPPPAECRAADYQHLVGQKSPAISLPAGSEYRQYRKGDALTMDLKPNRINFEYDRTGKLIKVSCG